MVCTHINTMPRVYKGLFKLKIFFIHSVLFVTAFASMTSLSKLGYCSRKFLNTSTSSPCDNG